MKVLSKFLTGLCLCLLSVVAPVLTHAQFRFDTWTTDNGLPQASVNSILQTRDGYLWLTTFGGLVRYDGLRFEVFDTGNTPGLRTSRFLQLFEDREGTMWIVTERLGVSRYRDGVFTTYSADDGLPNCLGIFIHEDKAGRVLFECMVREGEVQSIEWTGSGFSPAALAPGEPTRFVERRSADGGIWYTEGNRLRKYLDGRITVDYPSSFPIKRVFEDSQGRVWMGSIENSLLYMLKDGQITSYSPKDGLPDARFLVPFEDRQHRIWFGTAVGLTMFQDGKFTSYSTADGLARGMVVTIEQDREGSVWVGTSGGLSRITTRAVTSYSSRDGLAGDNVYPIYEDSSGKIWIGSWFGLTVFENGKFENVSKQFGLSDSRITSFLEDRDGNFWIATLSEGIFRIKNGQVTVYPTEQVRSIYQGRDDPTVWFGRGDGLLGFKDEKFTQFNILPGQLIMYMHEDRFGSLWLGTEIGLFRYKNEVLTPVKENEGFRGGIVRTIKEDVDGTMWIGMYDNGLYRFKDGVFARITVNDGLFDNGVFEILDDENGNLWISCNLGIYRLRKSELNDFADGRIARITSIPYNKLDGMLNSECNGGVQPAGVRARDGRLWFPTQEGVAVITPNAVPFNPLPPPVVIQSLTVDTRRVDLRAPVNIQPGQTHIEINYSGLSFINPELVKFKYRIDGLDENWIDAGSRRTAYFTHLPPGKYTFRVQAANRDGVWNETGAALEITVLPQFWQTLWFSVLASVFVIAIGYFIYRRRIRVLKQENIAQEAFSRALIESQEAERERIAAGLHDNLGQHLIIIKNWASLGLNFTDKDAAVREQLDEISSTAVQALNEVREIIHDLRPYQLETIGLSNTIKYMMEQVASSSGINFTNHCDELDKLFSHEDEVTFYRMIQECVSNIVKHSDAKNAGLGIRRDADSVKIIVTDDGRGFDPDAEKRSPGGGFGLTGLKERVKILRGSMVIDSGEGKGTTISIILEAKG